MTKTMTQLCVHAATGKLLLTSLPSSWPTTLMTLPHPFESYLQNTTPLQTYCHTSSMLFTPSTTAHTSWPVRWTKISALPSRIIHNISKLHSRTTSYMCTPTANSPAKKLSTISAWLCKYKRVIPQHELTYLKHTHQLYNDKGKISFPQFYLLAKIHKLPMAT